MAGSATETKEFTEKGRRTRERIVAVAAQLVHERGEAAVGIRDVKQAAGVSGSQMTHYFPDRQTLMRAVVARRSQDVAESLRRPVLGDLDSFEKLRAWADMNVKAQRRFRCQGGCTFGALVGQMAESDEVAREGLAAGYADWIDRIAGGLESMRRRGELRDDADPRRLALGLIAAHQGGATITQATRDVEPLATALDSAIDYVESFAT
jgi:AcrR family transcriptional regulator